MIIQKLLKAIKGESKMIVSVKVQSAPPFTSVYYVGVQTSVDMESITLKNPMRYAEIFIPKKSTVTMAGQESPGTELVPMVQSIEEGGISLTEIQIQMSQVLAISEITEESIIGLFTDYPKAIANRQAELKKLKEALSQQQ